MKMLWHNIFQWIAKWQVVFVSAILTVIFIFILRAPGILDLQFAFSERNFSRIINRWHNGGILQVQKRNLWIDLFFPLAYAVFLSSLLALLTVQSAGVLSSGLIILLTLPFIAGLFDWAENILHLFLLRKTSNFSEPLIFLASTAASIKWSLVIVSVLAIIYHLFM